MYLILLIMRLMKFLIGLKIYCQSQRQQQNEYSIKDHCKIVNILIVARINLSCRCEVSISILPRDGNRIEKKCLINKFLI